jgi:hypothetical protein
MSDGRDHRKILNAVLHAVAGLPLQNRVAILRMAMQLIVQKIHEQHVELRDPIGHEQEKWPT